MCHTRAVNHAGCTTSVARSPRCPPAQLPHCSPRTCTRTQSHVPYLNSLFPPNDHQTRTRHAARPMPRRTPYRASRRSRTPTLARCGTTVGCPPKATPASWPSWAATRRRGRRGQRRWQTWPQVRCTKMLVYRVVLACWFECARKWTVETAGLPFTAACLCSVFMASQAASRPRRCWCGHRASWCPVSEAWCRNSCSSSRGLGRRACRTNHGTRLRYRWAQGVRIEE